MRQALLSTLLHIVAVAVPLVVAFVLIKLVGVENQVAQGAIALVLVGLEKFVRTHEKIPVGDYVNF